MNEEVIQKILNYRNNICSKPDPNLSEVDIRENAYELWAIDEILCSLWNHPFTDAETVIENFVITMQYFLHISESETASSIFTIAENTAEDILLSLILEQQNTVF